MNVTRDKVALCDDCIWMEAYGERIEGGEPDAVPLSKLAARTYLDNDPDCRDGECEGHFDRFCDGCETVFAGNRYCYVVTVRTHDGTCPCSADDVNCANALGWCTVCTCFRAADAA